MTLTENQKSGVDVKTMMHTEIWLAPSIIVIILK